MPKYLMPVGNSNFSKMIENHCYYIDKTNLVKQLLVDMKADVTLITRPRRFGKTLNMSMLEHFFDIRRDSKSLFENLKISENREICDQYMNQYPTVFISLKDVGGLRFEQALERLRSVLSELYMTHSYLLDDPKIDISNKEKFIRIKSQNASENDITDSLILITKLMYEYYQKTVIILIDEYDVPMAKGSANGYYREITDMMRYLFGKVLKDDPYLEFAVLTGCLRLSKESIFTGLNNLYIDSIANEHFDEYFGFTDEEMNRLLQDTGLTEYKPKFKKWYDGYRFGEKEVYCPWDVINYAGTLQETPGARPRNFWANTSGNEIIKEFISKREFNIKNKMEALLRGETIQTPLYENLTYDELTNSEMNFWSVLYFTGYLTVVSYDESENIAELRIPNTEVKEIFKTMVLRWFNEKSRNDNREELFNAIWSADSEKLTKKLSAILFNTISYYDYNENFYHAFLAGLVSEAGYDVESNRERGTGRSDIVLRDTENIRAAVFELKITDDPDKVKEMCAKALEQIKTREYDKSLIADGYEEVVCFGITFYKKKCFVTAEKIIS